MIKLIMLNKPYLDRYLIQNRNIKIGLIYCLKQVVEIKEEREENEEVGDLLDDIETSDDMKDLLDDNNGMD